MRASQSHAKSDRNLRKREVQWLYFSDRELRGRRWKKRCMSVFWESSRIVVLVVPYSFLGRLFTRKGVSLSLRWRCGLFFPMQPPRVHPRLLSSLSHTTPLRCPAFSSSPPLYLHVVEPTEGPNTQTRQGLASTSTALVSRWRCRTAVRVTAEAGGPRRRQSSKLLEAKRKCRQRARRLRVSIRDCRCCHACHGCL